MVIRRIDGDDENVVIEGACVSCRKPWEVKAPLAGVIARQNGALIQVAFPKMSAAERELFVSGICDDCFPKAPDEDEDADDCDEDDCDGCGGCGGEEDEEADEETPEEEPEDPEAYADWDF